MEEDGKALEKHNKRLVKLMTAPSTLQMFVAGANSNSELGISANVPISQFTENDMNVVYYDKVKCSSEACGFLDSDLYFTGLNTQYGDSASKV